MASAAQILASRPRRDGRDAAASPECCPAREEGRSTRRQAAAHCACATAHQVRGCRRRSVARERCRQRIVPQQRRLLWTGRCRAPPQAAGYGLPAGLVTAERAAVAKHPEIRPWPSRTRLSLILPFCGERSLARGAALPPPARTAPGRLKLAAVGVVTGWLRRAGSDSARACRLARFSARSRAAGYMAGVARYFWRVFHRCTARPRLVPLCRTGWPSAGSPHP